MDAIELLLTRQSDAKLTAPGPNSEQLDIIKQAALRVPDHGCIAPWQFIVVQGDARHKLGEIYHQSAVAEQQEETAGEVAQKAFKRGYNVSARVHCYLWGNLIGV